MEPDKNIVYYLCGPMTGFPNGNYLLFMDTSNKLRVNGYKVINPAELSTFDPNIKLGGEEYINILRNVVGIMVSKCTAIILLPEWNKSLGATIEYKVASLLGFKKLRIEEFKL